MARSAVAGIRQLKRHSSAFGLFPGKVGDLPQEFHFHIHPQIVRKEAIVFGLIVHAHSCFAPE
jgi:hypothetical protein